MYMTTKEHRLNLAGLRGHFIGNIGVIEDQNKLLEISAKIMFSIYYIY